MRTLNIEMGELTLEVEATYRPGTPDVHTLPNGDPGYPGDPPELDIDSVTLVTPLGERLDVYQFLDDLGAFEEGSPLDAAIMAEVDKALEAEQAEADEARADAAEAARELERSYGD